MKAKQHGLWWIGWGESFWGWVSSWFERNPWETQSLTCNFAFRKTLLPCLGTYWQSLPHCS
jgi:hypothetical protein